MPGSYLPRADAQALAFMVNFANVANSHLATLGFTPAEAAAMMAAATAFDNAMAAHATARNAAIAATAAKNLERQAAQVLFREFVLRAYANPDVNDALRAELGLKQNNPPSAGAPVEIADLVAVPHTNGVNELKWNRNGNKPGTIFVVQKKEPDATEWEWVGNVTGTTFKEPGQAPGHKQMYRVVAQRNNLFSPPSAAVAVYGSTPGLPK